MNLKTLKELRDAGQLNPTPEPDDGPGGDWLRREIARKRAASDALARSLLDRHEQTRERDRE